MSTAKKLSKLLQTAEAIPFDNQSHFVFISDCHRGVGNNSDNFAKNQNLYYNALLHYDRENYTYIELGDGDELWENSDFSQITREYAHIFSLLSKLYEEGRFRAIYGNHDKIKGNPKWASKHLVHYSDDRGRTENLLFPGQVAAEALILRHAESGDQILLTHGHQGDPLNDTFWRLSRFLVKYLWQPLESIGIMDPTSTSQNNYKKDFTEKKLMDWCRENKQMLIAGHTHRPAFPFPGDPLYFNDGSCVHPRCITALEIASGTIALVKWHVSTRNDGTLYVTRSLLEGPLPLRDFWNHQLHPE